MGVPNTQNGMTHKHVIGSVSEGSVDVEDRRPKTEEKSKKLEAGSNKLKVGDYYS